MTSTIRYGHSRFGGGNAVLTMTIEQGLLAERGIEVERKEFGRTSDATDAALRREVDVVTCPGVSILRAAMAGGDPLNVMSIEDENVLALMAARDVSSAEDLRGSTVGVVGFADQDGIVLRRALRECGLNPDEDVTFEDFGNRGALWQALVDGDVSAMCATIPQPLLARKIGLPVLLDFSERQEPYQCGTIVTTRRFADENPDLLREFLAGLLRGVELFQSDFDLALPHLKARSKLDDVDVLRETHRLFSEAMNHYVPSTPPIEAVARDLEAAIGTPLGVDVGALIDTQFVPPYTDASPSMQP